MTTHAVAAPTVSPAKQLAVAPKVPKAPPQRYRVYEVIEETKEVKSLRVSPENGQSVTPFQPGMFVDLHLPAQQGHGSGWNGHFAPYSIASSPTATEYYELTYKRKGAFTQALWNLKPGDLIGVSAPQGKNYYHEGGEMVLIAGGIGITPCMAILRYATAIKSSTKILLLYSNRTPADIVYHQEMHQLIKENPNLKIVHTLTRHPKEHAPDSYENGRIDQAMLHNYVPNPTEKQWFLCGGIEMTREILKTLRALGVNFKNIHFESWG